MINLLDRENLFKTTETIVKSLSLSYYLKNNEYAFKLDEQAPTSYHNGRDKKIVIAFNNIYDALVNAQNLAVNTDADFIEKRVRGCLYHECLHAMLTPPNAKSKADAYYWLGYYDGDIFNILCDEKNETLFDGYFIDTDFVANKKYILGTMTQEQALNNFKSFVFACVRLHLFDNVKASGKYIKMINKKYINGARNFNSLSSPDVLNDYYLKWAYTLYKAYREIISNTPNNQQQQEQEQQEQEQEQQQQSNNNESDGANDADGETEQEQQTETENESENKNENETETETANANAQEQQEQQEQEQQEPRERALSRKEQEQIMREIMNEIQERASLESENANGHASDYATQTLNDYKKDAQVFNKLANILTRNGVFTANRSSVKYGLGGRFKTNAYIKDEQRQTPTYKYFKSNLDGTNKERANDKKELLIILDNSGSFKENDKKSNTILRALADIEKMTTQFEFTLLAFNFHIYKRYGMHRVCQSGGGSSGLLRDNISEFVKITPNMKILMLTDGEIVINDENVKILNNKNVAVISDYSNKTLFAEKMPNAHVVITHDYTQEFANEIIKQVARLFN